MTDILTTPKSDVATCKEEDPTKAPEADNATCKKKDRIIVCRYFKKGFCGYGEKCFFEHIQPRVRSDIKNCIFFKKASCKFASKCWYDHIGPNGKPYPRPDPLNKFIVVGPSDEETKKADVLDSIKDSTASQTEKTETRRHFRRPQNVDIVSKNCFYYEWNGKCYYEDHCWYNHRESRSQVHSSDEPLNGTEINLEPDKTKLCYNFIFTECEFGDSCLYTHGDVCQFCDLPFLHPEDMLQRNEHLQACEILFLEDMEIAFAFMRSKDKTCSICLDNVWDADKAYTKQKFGILENCNHIFCFDCIRRWKNVKQKSNEPRLCPACREEISVIVPSTHWFENEEQKQQWLEAYKNAVGQKPCKFYERGKCWNRADCHFLHQEFVKPLSVDKGELVWDDWDLNNEPAGEQENRGNIAERTENIDNRDQQDPASWQNFQDDDIWNDMPSEDQTRQHQASQSGEPESSNNLADVNKFYGNEGQTNIVDAGDEQNEEIKVWQDSEIWDDTSPEDTSNEQ